MKTLKLIPITLLSLFIFSASLKGQDLEVSKKSKHSLGAGLGFTTGYGLSYRYAPSKWGIQVNFAPFKNSTQEVYSVGCTFLYKLNEGQKITLYLYQGNHYYYNQDKNFFNENTNQYETKTDSYSNSGVGFGIEIPIFDQIGFNLMTGYAAYENFKAYNLTGEAALYFKF
jgi:hypothetical protein